MTSFRSKQQSPNNTRDRTGVGIYTPFCSKQNKKQRCIERLHRQEPKQANQPTTDLASVCVYRGVERGLVFCPSLFCAGKKGNGNNVLSPNESVGNSPLANNV